MPAYDLCRMRRARSGHASRITDLRSRFTHEALLATDTQYSLRREPKHTSPYDSRITSQGSPDRGRGHRTTVRPLTAHR